MYDLAHGVVFRSLYCFNILNKDKNLSFHCIVYVAPCLHFVSKDVASVALLLGLVLGLIYEIGRA